MAASVGGLFVFRSRESFLLPLHPSGIFYNFGGTGGDVVVFVSFNGSVAAELDLQTCGPNSCDNAGAGYYLGPVCMGAGCIAPFEVMTSGDLGLGTIATIPLPPLSHYSPGLGALGLLARRKKRKVALAA